MKYIIQNQSGDYMRYDDNRHISVTSDLNKATVFTEESRAYNFLTNCFPKKRRVGWSIKAIAEQDSKTQKPKAIRCNQIEESIQLEHSIGWDSLAEQLEHTYQELLGYRVEVKAALDNVEATLCDCEHACEVFKLDAAKGYKMYRMISAARMNRRFLKDELRRINAVLDCNPATIASGQIKVALQGIDAQVYEPRVLQELFDGGEI